MTKLDSHSRMTETSWEMRLARGGAIFGVVGASIFFLLRSQVLGLAFGGVDAALISLALASGVGLIFRFTANRLAFVVSYGLLTLGCVAQMYLPEPRTITQLVLVTGLVFSAIYFRFMRTLPALAICFAGFLIAGELAYQHPQANKVLLPDGFSLRGLWLNAAVGFLLLNGLIAATLSYVVTVLETSRRRSEENERLLKLFTELSSDYVYQINLGVPGLMPEVFAGSFERTTGYTLDALRKKGGWLAVVHPDDRQRLEHVTPKLLAGETVVTEYRIISATGLVIWLRDRIRPVYDAKGEAVTKLMGAVTDITERKAAEEQVENLAFYDPLTALPNRRLLLDRLEQARALSTRTGQHGALLFIDLDHFKNLNDTKGHEAGDQLLIEHARRLTLCVREGDTVARLGGDEFIVILGELPAQAEKAAEEAADLCQRILQKLSEPVTLTFRTMTDYENTCSIGVAMFSGHIVSVDELLRRADMAMYQAKADGRNLFRFFDPQMQKLLGERLALESDLKQALAGRQFEIYLQPQLASDRRVTGAEVLLRWHHPERGLVYPGYFITAAEHTGAIHDIGVWVFEQACLLLTKWAGGAITRALTLAVNVSARQFRQADFVDRVRRLLQQTGANPKLIKLELTESLALDSVDETVAKMLALRELGLAIALDDFGTGQSSLAYLKRLPLNELKIDQSFVRDITTDQNDAVLVQTIIGMAQNLNLEVVAEGVETEQQLDFLVKHGCPAYQGFFFSEPVPVTEFERKFAA
ncbi:diguanylate cyclase/phosphodiesterase with PAS/PAC sensor(s) [Turneriella parva DSM 21527]|uniref:Diguanylate cyclase/phosphodiesterase with PAS/PAC sensor(S) n=2 Tax=Turneriella TaxID=338321 RepID=I4B2H3_TURPD|nr:diguanylate cyclase/phosphodiesterase with PAS/PAC sensor(s) [Turneriella parva DSM 21527]